MALFVSVVLFSICQCRSISGCQLFQHYGDLRNKLPASNSIEKATVGSHSTSSFSLYYAEAGADADVWYNRRIKSITQMMILESQFLGEKRRGKKDKPRRKATTTNTCEVVQAG
jgi:hypothetical protein